MRLTAVIVDGERSSVENLQWKLEQYCPEVKVERTFTQAVKALGFLKGGQPELLFLDIEMPLLNVFLDKGRKKLIYRTLKDFELALQPFGFYRPHYSYLINLHHIKEFIRGEGGYLIMSNGMKVPVTKSRRPGLLGLVS